MAGTAKETHAQGKVYYRQYIFDLAKGLRLFVLMGLDTFSSATAAQKQSRLPSNRLARLVLGKSQRSPA